MKRRVPTNNDSTSKRATMKRAKTSIDTFDADIKLALESIEAPDSSLEEQLSVTPQASTSTQALDDPDADPMEAIAYLLREYELTA